MKPEHAGSLIELTSTKCSSVKYDVEIVEEYFARQVCYHSNPNDRTRLCHSLWPQLINILRAFKDLVILLHRLHHRPAAS